MGRRDTVIILVPDFGGELVKTSSCHIPVVFVKLIDLYDKFMELFLRQGQHESF